jgi:hypothetical protein
MVPSTGRLSTIAGALLDEQALTCVHDSQTTSKSVLSLLLSALGDLGCFPGQPRDLLQLGTSCCLYCSPHTAYLSIEKDPSAGEQAGLGLDMQLD